MNIDLTKVGKLNTLFLHSPGATSASVQFWFKAGSALESEDHFGIAHFLEHMFFKGTASRPDHMIAHEVESFGGEINAFTSFDYTCYYINTPTNHLGQTVEILADMVANPLFAEEHLVPEREVVNEEYKRSQDSSSQYSFQFIQAHSFTGGYAHPILGNPGTILNFTRKQLIQYRSKFYNNQNSMLVIAGDLSKKNEIIEIIKKYKLPDGEVSKFEKFELKESGEKIHVHNKDTKQATITLVMKAPAYLDPSSAAEDVAINCLAHGETSRFYKPIVRDTSIASGVSGSTMYLSDGGVHFLRFALPPKNLKNTLDAALKVITQTFIERFNPLEIKKIINQYVASKVYEKESIESLAFSLGHGFAQTGNIHCEDDFINAIKNVTTEQVFEALINIFKRNIQYHLQLPEGLKHPEYKKVISDFDKKLQTLVRSQKSAKIQKSNIEKSQKDPQVTCFEIKPGIRLIHRENTQTPTFVLHAYLKGGLTYETASTAGSHYLISRNIACGHSKKDYTKLKTDLEMRSASLSGFGGKNAYGLTMHGQTEHWEDLVDDFFLTLLEPSLPIKYFNNEKKLINRALDNMKTDPVKQCFSAYNKHIFKGHPYQLDIIGSKESLKKISRDQIAKLHQKRLDKEEIVITYAGDIPANKIFDIVTEKLRNLPERARKVFLPKKVNSVAKDINIKFNREQTQIFIGYPAFSNQVQEDVYLKILTTHLSGQSSDLFVEVRDRQGLCYAAQAVHHNAIEAGYWGIFIGTGNDKTEKAIAAIKSIINKIATDGLSEEEVERIKKMIIGQNLVGLQTNEDFAQYYSVPYLHHLGIDFETNRDAAINRTKTADLNKFLSKFFSQKASTVIVGKI